jgi:hypothetical protein
MKKPHASIALAVLAVLAVLAASLAVACAAPAVLGTSAYPPAAPAAHSSTGVGGAASETAALAAQGPADGATERSLAPLRGWDGEVIAAAVQGEDSPVRGIEPSHAGRMHIIELYQKVLDERDALAQEASDLSAAIEESQAALASGEERTAQLELRIQALESDLARSQQETLDLAGRLATAQIRRLEAEKMLLESRIESHRARAEAATSRSGPGAKPPATPPAGAKPGTQAKEGG